MLFDCMQEVKKYFCFIIVLRDDEKKARVTHLPVVYGFTNEILKETEQLWKVPLPVCPDKRKESFLSNPELTTG